MPGSNAIGSLQARPLIFWLRPGHVLENQFAHPATVTLGMIMSALQPGSLWTLMTSRYPDLALDIDPRAQTVVAVETMSPLILNLIACSLAASNMTFLTGNSTFQNNLLHVLLSID